MPKAKSKTSNVPVIKTDSGIALVQIPLPSEVFDVEEAFILRRKRIAIWKLDSIKDFKPGMEEEMYALFADLIPQWEGVIDVETGEPLPNLQDDPKALTRLDTEQLAWLTQSLRTTPAQLAKGAAANFTNGQMS